MNENDLQEIEQLHAEAAEAETERQALVDLIAELMTENKALRGQLAILKNDGTYETSS